MNAACVHDTACCEQEWGLYADVRATHQDVLDAQMNDLEVCAGSGVVYTMESNVCVDDYATGHAQIMFPQKSVCSGTQSVRGQV